MYWTAQHPAGKDDILAFKIFLLGPTKLQGGPWTARELPPCTSQYVLNLPGVRTFPSTSSSLHTSLQSSIWWSTKYARDPLIGGTYKARRWSWHRTLYLKSDFTHLNPSCSARQLDNQSCDCSNCTSLHCNALKHNAQQCSAVQCNANQCNTVQCSSV